MAPTSVAEHLGMVLAEIRAACARSGRNAAEVTLVAVSKKQPLSLMKEYLAAAQAQGIKPVLGESYAQELKAKRAEIGDTASFHLLGPLQRNKAREAVRQADVIESVHSLPVLEAIAAEARKIGKRQAIFLQVNISQDSAKSGFSPQELAAAVAAAKSSADAISLEGIMTITALYGSAEEARGDFRHMSTLRADLVQAGLHTGFEGDLIRISMGMSADFGVAIEEGADLVRVGTALFGQGISAT